MYNTSISPIISPSRPSSPFLRRPIFSFFFFFPPSFIQVFLIPSIYSLRTRFDTRFFDETKRGVTRWRTRGEARKRVDVLGTRRADLGVRWHHHWPVNGQLPSRGSWDTCVITPRVITAIHLGVDGQSRGLFVDLHRFAPIKERVSLPFRLPFASPIASFHPPVPLGFVRSS